MHRIVLTTVLASLLLPALARAGFDCGLLDNTLATVVVSDDEESAIPTEVVEVVVAVDHNCGNDTITEVSVEIQIPDGWLFLDPENCDGTVPRGSGFWLPGPIGFLETKLCTFRLTPDFQTYGAASTPLRFTTSWTDPTTDQSSNNFDDVTLFAEGAIDLVTTFSSFASDVPPGQSAQVTITLGNLGNRSIGGLDIDIVKPSGVPGFSAVDCQGWNTSQQYWNFDLFNPFLDPLEAVECVLEFTVPADETGGVFEWETAFSHDSPYPELFPEDDDDGLEILVDAPMELAIFELLDSPDQSPGDGRCLDFNSFCSLRAAIMETNAWPHADRIELPGATFPLTVFLGGGDESLGDLDITDDLTIEGPSPSFPATILGLNNTTFGVRTRAIEIPDGAGAVVTLRNLVLADGQDVQGGGMRVGPGNELLLENVSFLDNVAVDGSDTADGGALWARSPVTATDVVFENNVADDDGGAISWVADGGVLRLERARFVDNRSPFANLGSGGALHLPSGAGGPRAVIVDSLFRANRAGFGAAISTGIQTWIVNTTVSGNYATQEGGGLRVGLNTTRLAFSTVAGNFAGLDGNQVPSPDLGEGGGIWINDLLSTVRLFHSVVADNEAQWVGSPLAVPLGADCFGTPTSDGWAAVERVGTDSVCDVLSMPTDLLSQELGLLPLNESGVHPFEASSPLVDAGDSSCFWDEDGDGAYDTPLETDQLGRLRPADGDDDPAVSCDPGAWERGALPPGGLFFDGFESGDTCSWGGAC